MSKLFLRSDIIFLMSLCFMTVSCSTLKVNTDYDKTINFSKYQSFSLYNIKTSGSVSQLNADRIANAIRREMKKKGFIESNNNPDLMINAVTILKNKQAVSATTNYYGYGGMYRPYMYYGGMGYATTSVNTYNYKDGSLMIDIVDGNTKKLVWEGTGNESIDKMPDDLDAVISKAVMKILYGFPPGKKK